MTIHASTTSSNVSPSTKLELPRDLADAQAAFEKCLPQLMQSHYGQWVAFHGDRLIGTADSEADLYETCFRRGLEQEQFIIRCLLPEMLAEQDITPLYST
jgi:hypothetical protein